MKNKHKLVDTFKRDVFHLYNHFIFLFFRQNQLVLLDTLDQEVTKFRECNALLDLNSLVCVN